jgi:outer membrane protein assembly factor BamB
LVEKATELRLVCLDPNKLVPSPLKPTDHVPDLVWVQTLGTANTKLPDDVLRRLHACHLAYADGILVCPTNAGAVLGVDLLSHSLVWAYSYRKEVSTPVPENIMLRRRLPVMPQPAGGSTAGERWRASAPAIAGGKVVFTSPDGPDPEIHCLNLRDGRRLWTAKRDGNNDLISPASLANTSSSSPRTTSAR